MMGGGRGTSSTAGVGSGCRCAVFFSGRLSMAGVSSGTSSYSGFSASIAGAVFPVTTWSGVVTPERRSKSFFFRTVVTGVVGFF